MIKDEDIKYIADDEIDLKELSRTILDKKIFILFFTSIITIASIIYAYSKTPIYEVKGLIEIGNYKVNDNNNRKSNKIILDDASQLSKKLSILYIDMLQNVKEKESQIISIKVPKGSKNFIEIKSEGISNETASSIIMEIVKYIKIEHTKILDDVKRRRENEISNVENEINSILTKLIPSLNERIIVKMNILEDLKKQIQIIDKNIKKIQSSNPSLAALKLMEKRDITNFIVNINNQILDIQDKKNRYEISTINELKEKNLLLSSLLLPHNYKNTQIVGDIITNDYPSKPKKKIVIIVSFIIGFMLSIFTIFFIRFVTRLKFNK